MSILDKVIQTARRKSPLYDLHPELEDRIPLYREYSDTAEQQNQGGYKEAADDYGRHVWVHKAVKVVADNLATLPVRVVRGNGTEAEPIEGHALATLLNEMPNDTMGASDLWREMAIDMLLGGEHGHELVTNASGTRLLEMWPRQPADFLVRKGEGGRRYRRVAAYVVEDEDGDPYELEPLQFVHYKFYNPANVWRGLAPIAAVRMGLSIDQLAQAWSRLFFKNGARPDYFVITPEGLTPSERQEIELKLMQQHGGGNAHRPIVLEQGITDIKAPNFAPKDLEWVNQRELARDEIGAIFGVPDEIMGYGRDTYENFATAERVLWTLTIVPLARHRDSTLTRLLRQGRFLQPGERLETDFSEVSALQEDRSTEIGLLAQLADKGYPVNRLNEYLGLGLPEIEGGDIGYMPLGYSPIGMPEPEPQLAPPPPVQDPPQEEQRAASVRNKAIVPEYGSTAHEAIWKRTQERIDEPVDAMQRKLKRYFQDQQNEIARLMRSSREYGRGKWVKQPEGIPTPGDVFNLIYWVEEFIRRFEEDIEGVLRLVAGQELADLGVSIAFGMDRPEVVAAFRELLEGTARKVNDTTWINLTDLFREAEREGESIPAIQERLSAYFGGRKSDFETERIARTTMTGASNAGSVYAWEQSGVVSGKTWLSALAPGRTREAHAGAHGQTRRLKEMFTVGGERLQHPGDPSGSPGNVINCLCTMVPEVME